MAKNEGRIKYVKDILTSLLIAGIFIIAVATPGFGQVIKIYFKNKKCYKRKNFTNAFYYLRDRGLIKIERKGKQIYIKLTKKGKKLAGKYQIDDLLIKKPKKWDKKWRVVIFDIPYKQRPKREALRGKLKELGFYQLQKSVWLHPFNCEKEVGLLRNFFGIKKSQLRILEVLHIGDDREIRDLYHLK